ncbi:unnamed protein product [Dimorphilus gyrociliatus]|uniref:BZIP domain-containing protein n=1 Tax=Dimorphilus gyrociliatus TaxID=2664684 RepID=A0A7I8VRP9_9ANNE|nr:unnamed protein product [Dimorphilus gyrociliatus]
MEYFQSYDSMAKIDSDIGPTSPTPMTSEIGLNNIEASTEGTVNVSEYLTPTTNIDEISFDNVLIDEDMCIDFKQPDSRIIEAPLVKVEIEPADSAEIANEPLTRRGKGRVPKRKREEKGSFEYMKKRQKNNESVRKCREKAKERQAETEKTLHILREENSNLKSQLAEQSHENKILKQLLQTFIPDRAKEGVDLLKCLKKS